MSNALRTLALTAAMAGLAPMAAQAAVVHTDLVIKFEGTSWALNTPGDIQYTSGVTITNAQLIDTPNGLALVSATADPIANPITINFTQSDLFHLNTLTLEHANGADIDVQIKGQDGGSGSFKLLSTGLGSGGVAAWKTSVLGCKDPDPKSCSASPLLSGDEFIKSISFAPNFLASGDLDLVGLNFLNFTLSGTTGGTVPEPAGYGLAALALLAAGAASRRRNVH